MVRDRVGEDQKTRLKEVLLDLVSEGTRREATSNGDGASVLREAKRSERQYDGLFGWLARALEYRTWAYFKTAR